MRNKTALPRTKHKKTNKHIVSFGNVNMPSECRMTKNAGTQEGKMTVFCARR